MTNPANALDCTATAGQPDLDCGAGFLMADRAVQAVDTTPTHGERRAEPGGSQRGQRLVHRAGHRDLGGRRPADGRLRADRLRVRPVPPDGTTTLTCTARSIGGSATGSVTVKRDSSAPTNVISSRGSRRRTQHGTKPVKKKVKCKAKDAGSGIATCMVNGLKTTPGKHTVTVTATNNAGLVTHDEVQVQDPLT